MSPTLVHDALDANTVVVLRVKPSSLVYSSAMATSYIYYTEIIPDASRASLQVIIRGGADINSITHTNWRGYDGLVDIGFDKHFRVNPGADEFAIGSNHVNGIESFWSYIKRRMVKFTGVHKHTFLLHLQETEFRFNNRKANLYKSLPVMLRNNPVTNLFPKPPNLNSIRVIHVPVIGNMVSFCAT
mgnify:CR=1 FL=1